jgi:hypothetical protein
MLPWLFLHRQSVQSSQSSDVMHLNYIKRLASRRSIS